MDVVAFTGSTATGRAIAAECARQLKPVSLELGGKTPLILFEDADVDAALPTVLQAPLLMNGQFCCAGSRLLVHRAIAGRVRDALVAALARVNVASPEDPASQLGPVVDRASVARLDRFVEEASAYATVLVRGGPVVEGPLAAGSHFRPALVEVAEPNVPVVQQELFGPVLALEVFDDEADAVRRANATEYGLAAAVFTNDRTRMRRVGRALQAGAVRCNTWGAPADEFPRAPTATPCRSRPGPRAPRSPARSRACAPATPRRTARRPPPTRTGEPVPSPADPQSDIVHTTATARRVPNSTPRSLSCLIRSSPRARTRPRRRPPRSDPRSRPAGR